MAGTHGDDNDNDNGDTLPNVGQHQHTAGDTRNYSNQDSTFTCTTCSRDELGLCSDLQRYDELVDERTRCSTI